MLFRTFVTMTDAKPDTPRSLALTVLSNVPVTEPAMNCCGSSTASVTLGVTVMLKTEPGALGVCTSHAAKTRVASVTTDSARDVRLFGVFLMGLLQLR